MLTASSSTGVKICHGSCLPSSWSNMQASMTSTLSQVTWTSLESGPAVLLVKYKWWSRSHFWSTWNSSGGAQNTGTGTDPICGV